MGNGAWDVAQGVPAIDQRSHRALRNPFGDELEVTSSRLPQHRNDLLAAKGRDERSGQCDRDGTKHPVARRGTYQDMSSRRCENATTCRKRMIADAIKQHVIAQRVGSKVVTKVIDDTVGAEPLH